MVAFELVVPAHDEELELGRCVERLVPILSTLQMTWHVTIVDSGSTDATWELARQLASRWGNVDALQVAQPGRGRALRAAWTRSDAEFLGYVDADLSADPHQLPEMVETLRAGRADVVIASRLAKGASVQRSLRRELLSRGTVSSFGPSPERRSSTPSAG